MFEQGLIYKIELQKETHYRSY